jgi:cysteine desulfurase
LIVAASEHPAVIESAEFLHRKEGFDLSLLSVDGEGFAGSEKLRELLRDDTFLVSVMHANNETGVIQDIRTLADIAHEKNTLFHTDAVQSIGKVKVDVKAMAVDMLSLTGHKIYGPKGTGALFIRQGIKISPLMYGGSHEKKRRPGTENVAGAVGLAKALEIAGRRMDTDLQRMQLLADYFIEQLQSRIADTKFNGPRRNRIPQTVNVAFSGTSGEPIILGLDMEGIAVASGSACTSGATEPSHVLIAMGIPAKIANGAIRFSMGRSTTKDQIDRVLQVLPPIVERLRAMSPEYNRAKV